MVCSLVHNGGFSMAGSINVSSQIVSCLKTKRNFLLSGGAGSGKTYTLIQTLHNVYESNANSRVACITYTNVAANEIKTRSPYSKLWVSTIHDFLWDIIKGYQKNLIEAVIELISSGTIPYSGETPKDQIAITSVEYKNYRRLEEGTISHDELLKVAEYMFKHYSLLSKILCDKFDYIFIDEYQDTQKAVVNIFLEHITTKATGKLCIGFFGDKMQSIYDTGMDIQPYVDSGQVTEIKKIDNYRCSQNVILLLNNLRNDLSQKPAKVNSDGSITNKTGSAVFLYSNSDFELSSFLKTTYAQNWDITNPNDTKLLFLTHRLIAGRSGWDDLLLAYKNNDMLLGNEPDRLARHLLKIGGIMYYFKQRKYDLVISSIQKKIRTIIDKKTISSFLSGLNDKLNETTIDVTIEAFDNNKLLRKDDRLVEYIENNVDRYDAIKLLPLSQVMAYYSYYNDHLPYSTQHGIKGAEFENVLVVMDNGNWNNYNFKSFFEESGKETVVQRTERIFYVCCSRAINNLVVYYPSPPTAVIEKAKQLFGENNVNSI